MARFFVGEDAIKNNKAVITGSDVKHISRVLRMEPGDKIELASGRGMEFEAVIREINNREVICEITSETGASREASVSVTLYQGLPKGEKMELIIQKSTELGVFRVVPVICERTVVKLDKKKAGTRTARWQRVAEEASKQSRRMVIPQVNVPLCFKDALDELGKDILALMPWEEENSTGIGEILKSNRSKKDIAVIIGPEGGFTRCEAELAKSKGVVPVSLGPRILRTETAGIISIAVILYELGDLGGTVIG